MDDPVAQAAHRLCRQRPVVGVHHPVDRAIGDRMRADVDAEIVQLGDDLPIHVRRHRRVPAVPRFLLDRGLTEMIVLRF